MNSLQIIIKKHWITFLFVLVILATLAISEEKGFQIIAISRDNFITMLGVIPPIFLLIGLLDVWVPRETMIKHMGQNSGAKGLVLAFLMATMAAGPLYAAFPIAALLIKKGARPAVVIFFLSSWTSIKIPLILFEVTALGVQFTLLHAISMTFIYLLGSLSIEKLLPPHEVISLQKRVEDMA